jgi:hypothetical protein
MYIKAYFTFSYYFVQWRRVVMRRFMKCANLTLERIRQNGRTDGLTARIESILCVNSYVVRLTRAGTSRNNVKKCLSP